VWEKEFDDLVADRIAQLKSVVYGRDAGLPVLQASQGYWPGAFRSTDQHLWIPTLKGLVSVNLDGIKQNPKPPPVVIERVAVDGHTLAAYEWGELRDGPNSAAPIELRRANVHLRLPPGHRRVQFDFAALSYTAPGSVVCKCRLQGFDDEWVEVRSPRTVAYGHLPPGDYRFQVIACNSDGVWNETGASLSLTSEPHVWERAWVRVAAGASVIGISAGVAHLLLRRKHRVQVERLKNQHAVERERARIAQDLHDDLGTTLTQIDILGALASRSGIPATEALEQVGQMQAKSREMVAALDEIVWAVNPRNDSLAALTEYLCGFAEEFLAKAAIHCRLDLAENLPEIVLQAELRHNLFLALKEALNNVVRHSGATEVWLRLTWSGRSATFIVQDNGIGFDPVLLATTDRNGLRNMMERMKLIGGKYELRSQPKNGTSVEFTFFLP
jgi:signal transduction histidine kinase